jgi:hypothetical protein
MDREATAGVEDRGGQRSRMFQPCVKGDRGFLQVQLLSQSIPMFTPRFLDTEDERYRGILSKVYTAGRARQPRQP